jgi:hypothetical protein
MSIDLNKIREKLRNQSNVNVTKDGRITPQDPHNDGTRRNLAGNTTLEPKRFSA